MKFKYKPGDRAYHDEIPPKVCYEVLHAEKQQGKIEPGKRGIIYRCNFFVDGKLITEKYVDEEGFEKGGRLVRS